MISGGACAGKRENCYIAAHDALTGKELWRFYTTPGPGEPGDESWGGAATDKRSLPPGDCPAPTIRCASLLYWGVANPMPDQRMSRHDGNPDAVSRTAPPICIATRPSRSIPTPASWPGITSICPATIGNPTLHA